MAEVDLTDLVADDEIGSGDSLTFDGESQEPEPEVAEPEPEPEPEPDLPPPDWLRTAGGPPEPPQQRAEQLPDRPQYPQPGPGPWAHQQWNQMTPDQKLERLINDPDSYINEKAAQIAESVLEQRLGPIAYYINQMDQKTESHARVASQNLINQTRGLVDQGFRDVILKDPAVRQNEQVRKYVDSEMKAMFENAAAAAWHGDHSAMAMFHNPKFFKTFLAAAKEFMGYEPNAVAPALKRGATVEGAAPPQVDDSIELPDELKLIADRMSPKKKAELLKEYKKTKKLNDFEPWH